MALNHNERINEALRTKAPQFKLVNIHLDYIMVIQIIKKITFESRSFKRKFSNSNRSQSKIFT